MRKALVIASFFALAQMSHAPGSFPASLQTEPTAAARGGGPGEGMHGGRGFAPGGEIGERGEREEHGQGEFRGHEEHERHEGRGERFEGGGYMIGPGGYYPYYEEPPDFYEPPEEPDYRYYCENPPGYYPNVMQCPSGWEAVPSDEGE
jgi:hypothetical protein